MVKTIDSKWLKSELLDMQRWEDEGGKMIENDAPLPDRLPVPAPLKDAGKHRASLQWNERFIIGPFQPNNDNLLIRKGKFSG